MASFFFKHTNWIYNNLSYDSHNMLEEIKFKLDKLANLPKLWENSVCVWRFIE